jgi:arylsulfatase A-like enzyme
VVDIAPSILNLFGLPIPLSMDGRSIFKEMREPVFLDEKTGSIFHPKQQGSIDISARLRKIRDFT